MNQVAIILPTFNSLEITTKPCVESILNVSTYVPFELILVDNQSSDGTREYLEQIKQQHDNIKIILNDQNHGYAKGNNIGIVSTQANYYVLLNSDTIVTDFWLDKLTSFLENHNNIGMVGPVSNSVSNEQMICCAGDSETEIIISGQKWIEVCQNDYFTPSTLGFFCVAVPKRIIDEVGLLDEEYGLGMFEDYDFCHRVKQAGYDLACMEDVFVYHKGSVSFKNSGIDTNTLFMKNLTLFESKHNVKWHSAQTVEPFVDLFNLYVNNLTSDNVDKMKFKIRNKLDVVMSLGFSDVYRDYITLYKQTLPLRSSNVSSMNPEDELMHIKSSLTWRLATKVHRLLDRFIPNRNDIEDTVNALTPTVKKIVQEIDKLTPSDQNDKADLEEILRTHSGKPIIIFFPSIPWNSPLYQRWQHIAINLSRHGFLYFFCTVNGSFDNYNGFSQVDEACFVTNRFDLLKDIEGFKICHLSSADLYTTWAEVELELSRGNLILYDFVDELHENVSNHVIGNHTFQKHRHLLEDERCIIVTTADKLSEQVLQFRKKNYLKVSNGVDYDHFVQKYTMADVPLEISCVLEKSKPILGYFGAFASWFDYELVIELAERKPDCEIVLIGLNYDGSLDLYDMETPGNITVIDFVKYQDLPRYAHWFDVALIPFRMNKITEATSPIKMFEYMALGHPIVATRLRECRKYSSVLVAENHEDFIRKIETALTLKNDSSYTTRLRKEALENSWMSRAGKIAGAIHANIDQKCQFSPDDYKGKKWYEILTECQGEISRLDPHPNYVKEYGPNEMNFWVHIAEWMQEDSAKHQFQNVLDIGSAYGTLALYAKKLLDCNLYCIDIDDRYISKSLINTYDLTFAACNVELEDLPWDTKFDAIIFTEVLEHFNFDPLPTLMKLKSALTENGIMYLSTPDALQWGKLDKYYNSLAEIPEPSSDAEIVDDHIYQYNEDELRNLLDVAGFTIEKSAYSPGGGARHFNMALRCRKAQT